MSEIHATAIVSEEAKIGDGCTIGAYSVIGPNVELGKDNKIAAHVVIDGHTKIGDKNIISPFASIGGPPQDLKYHGEPSVLEIGNQNIIREYVTLQPGTEGGGMLTTVGDQNLFMASSHVGHDAVVGDRNVFANSAALAGHVQVGSDVIIGGMCGIHQFVRLGDLSFLGAGAMVTKDIAPFCIAQGDRAGLVGLNRVGLERKGYSKDQIQKLKRIYKDLFQGSGSFSKRLEAVRTDCGDFPLGNAFLEFIESSKRGVTTARVKLLDSHAE